MTTASSCMMIELVMYGMIPRAKTAIWVRAPPENRFRKLRTPPWLACFWSCWTAGKLIPGTVTFAPSRYRAMMNSVNRILFRRSGIRNMFRKLESTGRLLPLAVGQSVALGRGRPGPSCPGRRSCHPCPRYRDPRGAAAWWNPSAASDRATSLGNLFHRDQVRHSGDHSPNLGAIGQNVGLADTAQTEGAQRATVLRLGADAGAHLGDFQISHQPASAEGPPADACFRSRSVCS